VAADRVISRRATGRMRSPKKRNESRGARTKAITAIEDLATAAGDPATAAEVAAGEATTREEAIVSRQYVVPCAVFLPY
jgi:hypothetical protein